MKRSICSILSLCACLSATAADFAFNFNTESDFKLWRIASQKLEPLTPTKDYAIFSLNSLRFKRPKWVGGMPDWTYCEAKPRIAGWTEYDRLLLDVTNPNPEPQRLSLFISDSKIPFRQALGESFTIEGSGCTRCVVNLSKFPKTVDRKDISILHLFTQRPEADMDLFIADIMLLKKGEKLPEVPTSFVKQLTALSGPALIAAKEAAEKVVNNLGALCDMPELKDKLADAKRTFHRRLGNS